MPVQFRSIQSVSVKDRMKKLDQFDQHAIHRGPTGVVLPVSAGGAGGRTSGSSNNAGGQSSTSSSASAAFRMPSLTMPLNMPISLAMASVPALNNLNTLTGLSGLVHHSSAVHPTSSQQCLGSSTPASVGSAGSLGANSFTDSDSDDAEIANETQHDHQRRPLTAKNRTHLAHAKCDGKSNHAFWFFLSPFCFFVFFIGKMNLEGGLDLVDRVSRSVGCPSFSFFSF
ncbi:Uncharacterized protein APZ42_028156 [Daphnia magna]|uniref:Uncharacterized protein n=1 Tax=Daphnia magna TaxID=35525 RepID=A0A164QS71_9CRUS|nr:Uncharacterized protein APZ42_028156 [Daphnia magna]